tara:strand:+ start:127 stop:462 length:336 start_codon:yes stop_codon:yes gene_type:complete
MAYKKHVFPLFLDAATVSTAGAGALAVTTSYHIVTPDATDVAYTVAAGTIPGQMMVIINAHASNDANITFASPFNAEADVISIDAKGEQVTAMWNGSAWVIISGEKSTTVA